MEELVKEIRDLKNEIEELKKYIMMLVNKNNLNPDCYPEPPILRKPIRNISEPTLFKITEEQPTFQFNNDQEQERLRRF